MCMCVGKEGHLRFVQIVPPSSRPNYNCIPQIQGLNLCKREFLLELYYFCIINTSHYGTERHRFIVRSFT